MRLPTPLVSTFDSHELEVSGLEWSPDGKFLASGGNDNVVNIWTNDVGADNPSPLRQLTDHQAGVKARDKYFGFESVCSFSLFQTAPTAEYRQ